MGKIKRSWLNNKLKGSNYDKIRKSRVKIQRRQNAILGKVNEVNRKARIESLEKDNIRENLYQGMEPRSVEIRVGHN